MRIKIKTEGFSLKTNSIKIAISCLQQLYSKRHEQKLVTEAMKEMAEIEANQIEIRDMVKKLDNQRFQKIEMTWKPEESSKPEENAPQLPSPKEDKTPSEFQKRMAKKNMALWTEEEDKIVIANLGKNPIKVMFNKELCKRHTPKAIATRLSILKNRNFKSVSPKRRTFLKKQMMDKALNVRARKEQKNYGLNAKARKMQEKLLFKKNYFWTQEEEKMLMDNKDKSINHLSRLFPNRKSTAIIWKLNRMAGVKPGNVRIKKAKQIEWTQLEKNFLADNLNKKISWLIKQPMLSGRSAAAINARRTIMHKELKKLEGKK